MQYYNTVNVDNTREYYIVKIGEGYFSSPDESDLMYDIEEIGEEEYSWLQRSKDKRGAYIFTHSFNLPKYTIDENWYWDYESNEEYIGKPPKTVEELVQHFQKSYQTEEVEVYKIVEHTKVTYEESKLT